MRCTKNLRNDPDTDYDERKLYLTVAGYKIKEAMRNVSKNHELCIENEELCIKNEGLCIKHDEFCSGSGRSSCRRCVVYTEIHDFLRCLH